MTNYHSGWQGRNSHNYRGSKKETNIVGTAFLMLFGLIRKILVGIFLLFRWFIRTVMRQKGLPKKLAALAVGLGLAGFILVGMLFIYYSFTLPNPGELGERKLAESTKILDRNGELLYEVFNQAKRELIPIEEVPDQVKQATIAIEDKDFYSHGGVDLSGILRAVFVNVTSGDPTRQGASTITQQFVRNAVLTLDKTFSRKLKEAILAIQLERKYSKDEILQLYFNEIPYGSNAFGIQAASQTFFGKDVRALSLKEAAYLASIPKAPTYFSPYGPNREALDARTNTVLKVMAEQGYITENEKNAAQNQAVEFRQLGVGIKAPHFSLYVQDLLAQKYGEVGLREGGFRVTTTLDLEMQKIAEEAIEKQAERNEKNFNASNAALVAIDPRTGQILALVGSRDFFNEEIDGEVNVAIRPRQPGSSFKPYVYATAFKEGMNPATMLMDVVTNFGNFGGQDYIPKNFNFQEYGPVSIRQALAGSLNIPAVKTLMLVGVSDSIDTAESMGITTLKDRSRFGPSLVLGGGEVKLLDHVSAFGVFANSGIRHEAIPILKIEDKNGRVLEEYKESRGREVLNPQVAYQINNILSDNAARAYVFGVNNNLTLPGRAVAAKTGTTQESKDAWTIGYTPSLAAGVWAGNNDNTSMRGAGGSSAAAPIWNEFMRRALENTPAENFSRPEGIIELQVDSLSGKIPTQYSPDTKTEIFTGFNQPKEEDDVHIPVIVDGQTQIFTVLHSEIPDNPAWEEPVRRWAEAHGYAYPPQGSTIDRRDGSIKIEINSEGKIAKLPWSVSVEVDSKDELGTIELFLDGNFLASSNNDSLSFSSDDPHVDGKHRLTAQVKTKNGQSNVRVQNIEFELGSKILISYPRSDQAITLPANIVAEASENIAPENVRFFARSSSGQVIELLGTKTKSQSGDVYLYTLNLSKNSGVTSGSYGVFADLNGQLSPTTIIKITN